MRPAGVPWGCLTFRTPLVTRRGPRTLIPPPLPPSPNDPHHLSATLQLHNFNEAVTDCSAALGLLEGAPGADASLVPKVTLRRGIALIGCELFERALVDLVAADHMLAVTAFTDLQATARTKLRCVCSKGFVWRLQIPCS